MISASHNPAKDNGLKVFAGTDISLPEWSRIRDRKTYGWSNYFS